MEKLKSLSRVTLAFILVIAIGTSLWFASPSSALEITVSPPASGTIGSTHSFTVTVTIEDQELVPIQNVTLYIYKSDARATYEATLANLPLDTGSKSYTTTETSGGAANVTATATWAFGYGYGYARWQGTPYYFGYGYGYGPGATSITYVITWTSPSGWPSANYQIDATLTANGDTFTKTSSAFSLTTAAEEAPTPEPGVTNVSAIVNAEGVFTQAAIVESEDGKVVLTIDEGTTGKTEEGEPLSEITIFETAEPPAPPKDASIVGLTYALGPDGATFDPPITITFTYDPADVPEGIDEEDLVIAFWDEDTGEWVALEGITVDPVANTVSGSVSHFTDFTIIAYASPPAFDRRLSGDRVGQHKAPPNTHVTIQISASTETKLAAATLADYFPASWVVSDAGEGLVSPVDNATSKIEWEVGDVSAGATVTTEYILLSPEETIPPTKYQFWSELSHSGGSTTSDPWEVTVADPAPKAPSKPYAMSINSTSIAVAWVPSDTADIEGYKIYRSVDGTSYNLTATLSGGQLVSSWVDSGLPASKLYYYNVSAWDNVTGESSLTTTAASATTKAPNPPRGLRATGGTGSISLTWNANTESNLSGYNVYRATVSNGTFSKINSTLVTTSNYTDSTPPVGSAFYYYRVTAVDSTSAEGGMSGEAWARPYYNPASGGPHISYPATTDACAACHRTHFGKIPKLLPASTEKDLCFTCHDGSGSQYNVAQEFVSPVSQHPIPDETLKCSSCHNAHRNWQTYPKLLSADSQSSGNAVCYTCHGATDPNLPAVDYQTPFEAGFHKPYIPNSPSGTGIQCTSHHKPHASAFRSLQIRKDESGCFSCHDGSTVDTTVGGDVFSDFVASSDADTHHDIFDADQTARGTKIECVNCHNPHTVKATDSIKKVVNPEDPSPDPADRWSSTISDFCVTCHDDAFPTQTEPFAPAPVGPTPALTDIKEAWYWGTDNKADQMGDATSSADLDPNMGYTAGEPALPCQTCHDPHGTTSPFHLRTKVYSSDNTTFKEGLIVIKMAEGEYDFRYFCNACHDAGAKHHSRTKSLPTNCMGCHYHQGSGSKF